MAFQNSSRNDREERNDRNERTTQDRQERQTLAPLTLTPEQVAQLSAMTKREDFLFFAPDEVEMILDLSNPCMLPDFRRFLYRAAGLGLNPLHNEIHMEYKWSRNQPKATFVLHIDGLRKIADRTGQRAGFSQKPGMDERGEYVESTVYRKDCEHPFVSRVYCQEFMQTGEYSLYKTKPYHMVAKCGEAFAYKQAFPVSGLNTEDEVEVWPTDQGPRDNTRETGPRLVQDPQASPYVVAEKQAEKQASEPAPQVQPQTQNASQPPIAAAFGPNGPTSTQPPRPLHQVIADRLKALGVEKAEITDFVNWHFRYPDGKLTQDQYIEAFTRAENYLKEHSIGEFRENLAQARAERAEWLAKQQQSGQQPAQQAAGAGDPVLGKITEQVIAKFPRWSPELVRIAALWCLDQVKDPGALDAFLIALGITPETPPGRIEALLAISRHMAMSSGLAILEYSRKTNEPLSWIEHQLSQAVGKPIRFARDIAPNAVTDAFQALAQPATQGAAR